MDKLEKTILIIGTLMFIALLFIKTEGFRKWDFGTNQIYKDKKECENLGGEAKISPWGIECKDYDEEGYRFYWIKDKEGYHKIR